MAPLPGWPANPGGVGGGGGGGGVGYTLSPLLCTD